MAGAANAPTVSAATSRRTSLRFFGFMSCLRCCWVRCASVLQALTREPALDLFGDLVGVPIHHQHVRVAAPAELGQHQPVADTTRCDEPSAKVFLLRGD